MYHSVLHGSDSNSDGTGWDHAGVMAEVAEAEGTVRSPEATFLPNPAHRPDMTVGIPEGIPTVMAEAEGFEPSMGL